MLAGQARLPLRSPRWSRTRATRQRLPPTTCRLRLASGPASAGNSRRMARTSLANRTASSPNEGNPRRNELSSPTVSGDDGAAGVSRATTLLSRSRSTLMPSGVHLIHQSGELLFRFCDVHGTTYLRVSYVAIGGHYTSSFIHRLRGFHRFEYKRPSSVKSV